MAKPKADDNKIDRPNVVVLAGPNGAGKSTAAPLLLRGLLEINEFVNADVIAQGLSGFAPDAVALEAGAIMLQAFPRVQSEGGIRRGFGTFFACTGHWQQRGGFTIIRP